MRAAIFGNSGSGKSTLAIRLAEALGVPRVPLDQLVWEPGGFTRERPRDLVLAEIDELAGSDGWIVEGVYTDLIERLLPRATALFWLDLEWSVLEPTLRARGAGGTEADEVGDPDEVLGRLLPWAESYWDREDPYSWKGHSGLFDRFAGERRRFRTREEIDAFLAVLAGDPGIADG